jgi:hypothetical protein
MTTTAFELDGYHVVKNFGVVRGIIVRSRSISGTIGAGLQTLVGGNITILTDLLRKNAPARARALFGARAGTGRQRDHWAALRRNRNHAGSNGSALLRDGRPSRAEHRWLT